jgi:hypothetical protein
MSPVLDAARVKAIAVAGDAERFTPDPPDVPRVEVQREARARNLQNEPPLAGASKSRKPGVGVVGEGDARGWCAGRFAAAGCVGTGATASQTAALGQRAKVIR